MAKRKQAAAPVRPRRTEPLRAAPVPERFPAWVRSVAEIPLLVIAAIVVTLLVKAFLAQAFSIPSASMQPVLQEGDRVVVSRTAYRLHEPNRGDIVVFPSPAAPPDDDGLLEGLGKDVLAAVGVGVGEDRELIKRIVGLPGELIEGRDGQVLIDGQVLLEPYLRPGTTTSDFGPIAVPDGEVFVMGDNRSNSHDSRFRDIGTIEVDSIIGRAIAKVWPPGRNGFL